MKRDICIVGLLVDERAEHAPEVQQVLTEHGSRILNRSGIPDPGRQRGIISLIVQATGEECERLQKDLQSIVGVTAKSFCLAEAIEFDRC